MAHDNKERIVSQIIQHGEAVEIQINRMISSNLGLWNASSSGVGFDTQGQAIVINHRPPGLREFISGDEYQKTQHAAIVFVLGKLGIPVHLKKFSMMYMDRLLVTFTKANHRPVLTLHTQFEAADRIRAILSAMVLAKNTKVPLIHLIFSDIYE
jgi:hypothetical protein